MIIWLAFGIRVDFMLWGYHLNFMEFLTFPQPIQGLGDLWCVYVVFDRNYSENCSGCDFNRASLHLQPPGRSCRYLDIFLEFLMEVWHNSAIGSPRRCFNRLIQGVII